MKRLQWLILVLVTVILSSPLFSETPRKGPSVDFKHGVLKVSDNHRYLVHADGTPFFYLGDTAWELFHRLNREDATLYLENRRARGFTVIQAVVLAELDGLNTPNPYGDKPLIENDPARPNDAYFKHVDFIVNTAKEKGIYIGMLPTWGDKVTKAWGKGPEVFTNPDKAYAYGKFLGKRYKDQPNIIWILGGDRVADGKEDIYRAMAKGIKDAGDTHLMTYHPQGEQTSSKWFHKDDWLDFNMLQSGHGKRDNQNYKKIQHDYNLKPTKPCLDGELRYEDHPIGWKKENGWFDDFDVRQAVYWSLFAGGFGVTYGCHDIWQMYTPEHPAVSSARKTWKQGIELPGAWDMMHVRALMQSHDMLSRMPDQSLIKSDNPDGPRHIVATRGKGYAFIYTPYGDTFTVNLKKISDKSLKAKWFDPRTGETKSIGTIDPTLPGSFDPPGKAKRGNDWVLVLNVVK